MVTAGNESDPASTGVPWKQAAQQRVQAAGQHWAPWQVRHDRGCPSNPRSPEIG